MVFFFFLIISRGFHLGFWVYYGLAKPQKIKNNTSETTQHLVSNECILHICEHEHARCTRAIRRTKDNTSQAPKPRPGPTSNHGVGKGMRCLTTLHEYYHSDCVKFQYAILSFCYCNRLGFVFPIEKPCSHYIFFLNVNHALSLTN